jgi:hypothetical protein
MTPPAPPTAAKPAKPAAKNDLVPPDEAFWVRYSPHHEFPLSAVSSIAAHVLAFVLLLLIGLKLAHLFSKPVHQIPVEAVRFEGGGGGHRGGTSDNPGVASAPQEVGDKTNRDPQPAEATPTEQRPELQPIAPAKVAEKFDVDSTRFLTQVPRTNTQAFVRLGDEVRRKVGNLQEGARGQGGSGSGGGQGDGRGTSKGSGQGPTEGSERRLTQREKRMLRWTMHFDSRNGADYLRQLHGLGAIMAIPVHEGRDGYEFKIVRDLLQHPAKLLDEDISKIQRIYWINDRSDWVAEVMRALSVNARPSHFVVFMPETLEQQLYDIEKQHAQGRSEDQILETFFQVRHQGDRYFPVFESIRFK